MGIKRPPGNPITAISTGLNVYTSAEMHGMPICVCPSMNTTISSSLQSTIESLACKMQQIALLCK